MELRAFKKYLQANQPRSCYICFSVENAMAPRECYASVHNCHMVEAPRRQRCKELKMNHRGAERTEGALQRLTRLIRSTSRSTLKLMSRPRLSRPGHLSSVFPPGALGGRPICFRVERRTESFHHVPEPQRASTGSNGSVSNGSWFSEPCHASLRQ